MARPQAYDRTDVLENALQLFWRQGYAVTTLPDLLVCTGLSRSSFYSAFGDKRSLFKVCFERYSKNIKQILDQLIRFDDPADAIFHYYTSSLQKQSGNNNKNGCLIVNSLVEFEGVDDELYDLARVQSRHIAKAFKESFSRAKDLGNIEDSHSIEDIVLMLGTLSLGIQVQRRAGLRDKDVLKVLNTFIVFIGGKPQKK